MKDFIEEIWETTVGRYIHAVDIGLVIWIGLMGWIFWELAK